MEVCSLLDTLHPSSLISKNSFAWYISLSFRRKLIYYAFFLNPNLLNLPIRSRLTPVYIHCMN